MKLKVFNGGMNNGVDKTLIHPTECVLATNVNFEKGILESNVEDTVIAPNQMGYGFIWHGSRVLNYDEAMDFTIFRGKLFLASQGYFLVLLNKDFDASPHTYDHWRTVIMKSELAPVFSPKYINTPTATSPRAILTGTPIAPDDCKDEVINSAVKVTGNGASAFAEGEDTTYTIWIKQYIDEIVESPPDVMLTIPPNYADDTHWEDDHYYSSGDRLIIDVTFERCCDQLKIFDAINQSIVLYDSQSQEELDDYYTTSSYNVSKSITIPQSGHYFITFDSDCCGNNSGGTVSRKQPSDPLVGRNVYRKWKTITYTSPAEVSNVGLEIGTNIQSIEWFKEYDSIYHGATKLVVTAEKFADNPPYIPVVTLVGEQSIVNAQSQFINFIDNSKSVTHTVNGVTITRDTPDIMQMGNMEEGTYTYAICTVNPDIPEYERLPLVFKSIEVKDKGLVTIDLRNVNTNSNVYNIYRVGGSIDVFTLVASNVPRGWYIDDKHSDDLEAKTFTMKDTIKPSPTILEASNNMLWCNDMEQKDIVRFSDINKEWVWNAFSWVGFKEEVRGIKSIQNGVFVTTDNTCSMLIGDGRDNMTMLEISNKIGCSHTNLLQEHNGVIYFVGYAGFFGFNSRSRTLVQLNKQKLPAYVALPATASECPASDGSYTDAPPRPLTGYAFVLDGEYWVQEANGFMIYNIMRRTFRRHSMVSYAQMFSVLYGDSTYRGGIYTQGGTNTNTTIYKADYLSLPCGDRNLNFFTWISGILDEGEATNHKIYDNIFISYWGTIYLTIHIFDKGITRDLYYNLPQMVGSGRIYQHEIRIPIGEKRGYGIQFEVRGRGKVYEINYNVLPKQGDM